MPGIPKLLKIVHCYTDAMKSIMKRLVVALLGWQVRRLRKKNNFQIIGVVGSYGKTSTKAAIAQVLGSTYRVQWQEGNYNDLVSVPLVFFGLKMPKLKSVKGWLRTILLIERQLKQPYPYDVVVLELGTDAPGQLADFSRYLQINLAVITSIGPEHMEFFGSVADVAKEEFSVSDYAERLIVNENLIEKDYYQLSRISAEPYKVDSVQIGVGKWKLYFADRVINLEAPVVSEAQIFSLSTAYIVGSLMQIKEDLLREEIKKVKGIAGRMNLIEGKMGSKIIDDTYNSSPEAVRIALNTLYNFPSKKRIALLGSMNELGKSSADYHKEAGEMCDPNLLNLVVTLGEDANKYLAPAAEKKGCNVFRAHSPHEAGKYIEKILEKDAVVLAKGSQNGVFAEEAIKFFLAKKEDEIKLVRQNKAWLNKKQNSFGIK
jgi:UDP-N-acetylmuramoyl-tripeptide--D-alanyl-D-alanine ligase